MAIPLEWPCTPEQLVAAWPPDRRLACLWSGAAGAEADSRWCYFSEPVKRRALGPLATKGDLLTWLAPPQGTPPAAAPETDDPDAPPFRSGWMGFISYDAGILLEPRACGPSGPSWGADLRHWPRAEWHRCEWVVAFDRLKGRWWFGGDTRYAVPEMCPTAEPGFAARGLCAESSRGEYERAVGRALELLRAGDAYQVNVTHALTAGFEGSSRGLFLALCRAASPRFGALFEADDLAARRAFVSASPEMFLTYNSLSRVCSTRPMKGTRRAGADRAELAGSVKENAELNMIVDLMRNDLGRVCAPGSVRVSVAREIERHGEGDAALLQATATVEGTLRDGLTRADLIGATFPGGSITGAPKIRAMQIIDGLESSRRGPYCGAHGYLDDSGSCALGMTIRTALVTGEPGVGNDSFARATLRYGVGAGIVADSDPGAEWLETLDKGAVLERALGLRIGE